MTFVGAKVKREDGGGVKCPSCGGDMNHVIDSRPAVFLEAGTVRRRRACKACGQRQTTYEVVEDRVDRMKGKILRNLVDRLMAEILP